MVTFGGPYLAFIRYRNTRFIIYTDASATAGTLIGGAGIVVTEGYPANLMILLTKQQRGAVVTASYDEEKAAMLMTFQRLLT